MPRRTDSIPERFGYQWAKYRELLPLYESQFLRWIAPLGPDDFRGKKVLDAGCGMGRNSLWAATWGAREVVAFDADPRTVASASQNLREIPNAKVVLKSIYDIEWEDEFDIAFSVGVIHHLENPELAVRKLAHAVKPGGKVLAWLYGYEGNEWIVRFVSPLRRRMLSRLPPRVLDVLTYGVSVPLYLGLKILPMRHPYYRQLKGFAFRHIHIIVFDHLHPPISRYYRHDEAEALLRQAGLADVRAIRVNDNSWSVIGTKVAAP